MQELEKRTVSASLLHCDCAFAGSAKSMPAPAICVSSSSSSSSAAASKEMDLDVLCLLPPSFPVTSLRAVLIEKALSQLNLLAALSGPSVRAFHFSLAPYVPFPVTVCYPIVPDGLPGFRTLLFLVFEELFALFLFHLRDFVF